VTKITIKTKSRAEYIHKRLKELFPDEPKPPLLHSDPYTLLVAVLLSAQCLDERVNMVTPKLFALAGNPEKMMLLGVEQIEEIIRPCGLSNRKAKAIKDLSQILVEKHKGDVPSNLEDLEFLPGVGHKTASVVMVQAFQRPAFPVDTHIHRLAKAWKLSSGKNVVETEKDLTNLFAKNDWGHLHLRIIFYGRKYCKAQGCDAKRCILCQEIISNKLRER